MSAASGIILPADIERTSMAIITAGAGGGGHCPAAGAAAVVKRVIHTTADFDYAANCALPPRGGGGRGGAASRAPIVTDTNMALSGITKPGLARLGGTAACFMADPEVAALAKTALPGRWRPCKRPPPSTPVRCWRWATHLRRC